MYSKHRNSDSFREEENRKKMKRDHPVNETVLKSTLIDVNDMVKNINANNGNL